MKRLFETLAVPGALAAGAVLLAGCGGASGSATEVPAVTEARPSSAAPAAEPSAVAPAVAKPATSAKPGPGL